MPASHSFPELSAQEEQQLQTLVTRILEAWKHQDFTAHLRILPERTTRLWAPAIIQAVRMDLDRQWARGKVTLIESYLDHIPGIRENEPLLIQLMLVEYEVRNNYGNRPALAEYQNRFPLEFPEFRDFVQIQLTAVKTARPGAAELQDTPVHSPGAAKTVPAVEEVGGYRLIRCLGRGAFGEVWLAEAPGGIEVAVKRILQPMGRKDAEQEMESLELIKKLRHNNLVQLHQSWIEEPQHLLHIAMELADGSLRDRDEECKQLGKPGIPLPELVGYFYEAAEALDYIHSKNIIHRDVKPENILRLGAHAKLGDFGIAKGMQGGQSSETAAMGGTMNYMAPEVWENRISIKSDQYSLAVAYAELRLGRLPFRAANLVALMNAHLVGEPDLEDIPPKEQAVLRIALAKSTKDRYPSCVAFCKALIEAMEPADRPEHKSSFVFEGGPTTATATPPVVTDKTESLPPPQPAPAPVIAPPKPRPWKTAGLAAMLVLAAPLLLLLRQSNPWLPEGYKPGEGGVFVSPQGTKLYHTLVLTRPGLPPEEFLLIPPDLGDDLPPFYMMKNKMPRELYSQCPEVAAPKLAEGEDGRLPAMGMNWQDARACARWLGGDLPTQQEWDKAAGRFLRDVEGPYEGKCVDLAFPGDIVFGGEKAPRPVGTALKDVSRFGCRDMTGNGREWTRTIADPGDTARPWVDPSAPDPKTGFVMRGHSFSGQDRDSLPFERWGSDFQPAGEPVTDIGFRVVLKPGR